MSAHGMPVRDAEVDAEIVRKELGFASRFLDAVWSNLGSAGVLAVGVAAGWSSLAGGISPFMIPTALLAGAVPVAADAVAAGFDDAWKKRIHDGPECQALLARIRSQAAGIVASRRGSVWLVYGGGARKPRVMGDVEYAKFRETWFAKGLPLDEVTIERSRITASRLKAGVPDADGRHLPVREVFDTAAGKLAWVDWFGISGRRLRDEEAVGRPRPHYRATRYLAGGSGAPDEIGAETARAGRRAHYRASRFLSGGSGHEEAPVSGPPVPIG